METKTKKRNKKTSKNIPNNTKSQCPTMIIHTQHSAAATTTMDRQDSTTTMDIEASTSPIGSQNSFRTMGNQASTSTMSNQPFTSIMSNQPFTSTMSNLASTSSEGNQNLSAYVHNVTPVLSSTTTGAKRRVSTYFEMQLQTNNDIRSGVCFSPTKISEFQSVEANTSPVKLINYDIDKSDNKSILICARVRLFEMPVSFPKTTLKSNATLGSLAAVTDNQLISVVQLQGRKGINTRFGVKDSYWLSCGPSWSNYYSNMGSTHSRT